MDLLPFAISPWREPVCVGHQMLPISTSVVTLTIPPNCQAGSLEYESGPVAIRLDGGSPPDPATHPIRWDRDRDLLSLTAMRQWRAIRLPAATSDGLVRVSYFAWSS